MNTKIMTITVKDNYGIHIVNVNNVCAISTGINYIAISFNNNATRRLTYSSKEEVQEALEEISRLIEEKQ